MQNKQGLHALTVKANAVLDIAESVEAFNSQRFYISAPNAMQVSISGSSESKMHAVETQPVLDASYIQRDTQWNNMAMATADGLGESEDDSADNQNNADIAALCAESVCQALPLLNQEDFTLSVQDVARQCKESNRSAHDGLPYEARTAVSALFYQAESRQAHVLGMGDVLTVVFDGKTGALKYQQKARVYQQGKAAWAPIDIQMLASSKPQVAAFAAQALQAETWEMADSDIVVQMSDGIWSEFPTRDQEIRQHDAAYIESQIAVDTIQALDPETFATRPLDTLQALDIALILQHKAMSDFQKKLSQFKHIQPILSKALASEALKDQTMQIFVATLDPETATIFNTLFINEQHDAMPYHPEMPVSLFHQNFQKISFGDCATVSVLKIPSAAERGLMLIIQDMRALVQHAAVVNQLAQLSQETIHRLFDTLGQQRCTIGDKQRLVSNDPTGFTRPAYDPEALATLKSFMLHYQAYRQAEGSGETADLKRKYGLAYLQSIQNPTERRYIAHYLDQLTPCHVSDYLKNFIFKPTSDGITLPQYKTELSAMARR